MIPFLLLGVIWAAVLLPPWLHGRREARPTASIVNFRRQLLSLARTSPAYAGTGYADVHGRDDVAGYDGDADAYGDDHADAFGDEHDDRVGSADLTHAAPVPIGRARAASPVPAVHAGAGAQAHPSESARRRSATYRRRRQITTSLALVAAAGVAPAGILGGTWWVAPGVAGGLLVTYLSLLVQRQRRLAEQEQKVRYLTPIRAPRPAVVVLGSGAAR